MHRAAILLILALTAIGVSACGAAGDDGPTYAEREKAREQREAHARAIARRKAQQVAQAAQAECHATMDDLVDHLRDLDSSLSIGMNYADYTAAVRKVRVIYGRIDWKDAPGIDCLAMVGVPAEKALNKYADAADVWGRCVDDLYCDNDSVKPELQSRWSSAGRHTQHAMDGFDGIHR